MASSVATAGRNEMRINRRKFHSKLYAMELEAYYDRYDILRAFTLSALERAQAVYDHSRVITPVYLRHLEYGLHLRSILFLAVSLKLWESTLPNQAELYRYVGGVHGDLSPGWSQPDSPYAGHLIRVKTRKKEGHYYFQNLGDFKIISNVPESNKDWKKKFFWVFGADPVLSCSAWPEINKDVLRLGFLTAEDKEELEKVWAYTESRRIENLFDPAVLRVVGISKDLPTYDDNVRVAVFALLLKELNETQLGSIARTQKRLRSELAPAEAVEVAANAAEIATRLARVLLPLRLKGLRRGGGCGEQAAKVLPGLLS